MRIGSWKGVWSGLDDRSTPCPNPRNSMSLPSKLTRTSVGHYGQGPGLFPTLAEGAYGSGNEAGRNLSVAWKQTDRSGVDL